MGNDLAAAGIQLCGAPRSSQPAAAVGPEASRRSGLEVRIGRLTRRNVRMINERAMTIPGMPMEWRLPSPRKIAVACLILTESAMFSIFVVAYLFYIGKSLNGPYPAQVLETPIISTICLLGSSLTIVLAERALRQEKRGGFRLWWMVTIVLAAIFLSVTASEWYRLITVHHL